MDEEGVRYCNGSHAPDQVLHFILDIFRVQEPITQAIEASEDDLHEFYTDLRNDGIQHSILAYKGEEIVGVCLNHLDPKPSADVEPIPFDPFKDYAADIEAGPYKNRNANRIYAFICALEGDVHYTLGQPNSIFHIDVICVAREYTRQGIGIELIRQSIDAAHRLRCDIISTVATAKASQALFRKAGFYAVRELPFSCYRENRIPVFRNLVDGGRSGLLMAYCLKDEEDLK